MGWLRQWLVRCSL